VRPVATDEVAWSVSVLATVASHAKTAELTEMPLEAKIGVGPINHAQWHNLANKIEGVEVC